MLELKFKLNFDCPVWERGFNQTMLELKSFRGGTVERENDGFNQTMLELK